MKIIIAPDSFKGSLTAVEAANAINKGIKNAFAEAATVQLPIGDGGEGTMETLVAATNGEIRKVQVTGPLNQQIEAAYGILGDGITCVVEMASASGLHLVQEEGMSPLKATTYGTGELIRHALDDGFTSFIVGLGGSATNDGGAGMLQALGIRILNAEGDEIGFGGGALSDVSRIDVELFDERICTSTFIIASDVQNPLIGPDGASQVFGPQKGADSEQVELLDRNLTYWADRVEETTGVRLHDLAGAGAAGGIGGAFQTFFPVTLKRGVDVVLDYIQLDRELTNADLVITGEGQVDSQTAFGKTPLGVAQLASKRDVPTIILAGSVGEGASVLHDYGVVSIHSIMTGPMSLAEAIERAADLLATTAEQVVRSFFHLRVNQKGRLLV